MFIFLIFLEAFMQKIKNIKIKLFIFILSIVALYPGNILHAQTKFNKNLSWNMSSVPTSDIQLLQQFLKNEGYYEGEITGKYLSQTYKAVAKFQTENGLKPSGYFGSASRGKANQILRSKPSITIPDSSNTEADPDAVSTIQDKVTNLLGEVKSLQSKIVSVRQVKAEKVNATPPANTPVTKNTKAEAEIAIDAVVSEWSEWEATSSWTTCSNILYQTRSEERTRRIITGAKNGGVTPDLKETRTYGQSCIIPRAAAAEVTKIAVPSDAVVSAWSPWTSTSLWSTCSKVLYQTRTEERTRTVVTAAKNGGVTPTLKETRTYGQSCVIPKTATTQPPPAPKPVTPPAPAPISTGMQWGAYVGDSVVTDLASFETLAGRSVNIVATFLGFSDSFPSSYSSTIGAKGKKLLIFWEPEINYDSINNGSQDAQIKRFAEGAKAYGHEVILAPFHEMNGDWDVWGGTVGSNTPAKFISAWKRLHGIFKAAGATNVKFALAYNNDSVPDISGNQISDYYPGSEYVDYVGVDGFNFGDPWQTFDSIFATPLTKLKTYGKPIYIFSMGSVPGTQKAAWIKDALSVQINKYPLSGWVWFNQNGGDGNWLINSDSASLSAFKLAI